LRRMTGAVGRSAVVAAFFALHPLHVESVAWITERKDVLSTLFWMLTLGTYAAYAERPGLGRYLLVVVLFALGLAAKPMLVTLPCVLVLLDYWPLGRWQKATTKFLLLEKVPLLILSAVSCAVTYYAQQQAGAVKPIDWLPMETRISNALVAYVAYLGKALWPSGLAVFYPHPRQTLPVWQVVGAGLLLATISVCVIWQLRRRPYLAVGWFWFLGTLVPVIGLVQVGEQAMADRYTY